MKILICFNSMAPAGGIERVISKHIKFLDEFHEVVLLTNDSEPSFYDFPKRVKHLSLKLDYVLDMTSRFRRICQIIYFFMQSVLRIRKMLSIEKPSIIYVATPLNLLIVSLAQFSCKNIMVTEHASFSAYNKVYKFIARKLYKRITLLTVPTKDDSHFYSSIGIDNSYLPNPLPFYPHQSSNLDNKIVLNVGRFTNDKRHELLIRLWSRTKGKSDGWKLKIIGKGENFEKINKLIGEFNLRESVCVFSPTKEIEKEYDSASVFVLTSVAEGFGLVLAEAMAFGVPCVTFNCPSGPKDIVSNNVNGFLIDEGCEQLFVDKLDMLMNDENLRKRFGARARIDVKKFDESIISEELNNLVIEKFSKKVRKIEND